MEMTDPISGIGGKALSAIKPEQKKDEPVKNAESDAQCHISSSKGF
jgi:hypothetical protein